ncbi:hypothetical protein BBJ28_00016262 [Nothophytophthora sp. Chile5]|nr:hypothetical protein BBJ28_00016262 [Nothophytophthora sp. Chile5]
MNLQAALAVAAVAFVGSVAADTCSTTQQTSAYSALASVLTLSTFQGCTDDSGYSLLYSTSLPTDAEYTLMCASDNCVSLIASVSALDPPDCDLTVPTSGLVLNVYDLVSGFSDVCSSLSSSTTTTDAPTATTATTTTTTTTDAPTATTATTTSMIQEPAFRRSQPTTKVEPSELADVVAVSVEFDDVVVVGAVVVVGVAALLSVEAAVDVVAVVVVVVLAALDVVEVVDEPEDESDAHTSEKPFTSSYTFSTRPLVGTVRSQSGGSSAATAEISDWQSDEAHMSTYSASVGSDVE